MAGIRRWVALVVCFLINVFEIGTFKSFGVFLLPIQGDLQTTKSSLGLAAAICTSLGYLGAPLITRSCALIGERLVIIIGGIMCSMTLVLSALVHDVIILILLFTIAGIGFAMAYIAGVLAISKYFNDNFVNTAVGIMCTGGAVGVMLFPPIVESLIELYGWRGAMLLVGGINANIIVCGCVLSPVMRIKIPEDDPEIKAAHAVGSLHFTDKVKYYLTSFVEPWSILTDTPIFITVLVAKVFSNVVYAGWAIFLVPHAIVKGLSPQTAALLSTIGGVGAILGRLVPGPIIDKGFITAQTFAVVTNLVNAIAYFVDPLCTTFWSLAIPAIINGFVFGSDAVLLPPMCKEILGEKSEDGYGLGLIPGTVGGLIGGTLIGYFFDIGVDTFVVLGVSSITAAIFFAVPLMKGCIA